MKKKILSLVGLLPILVGVAFGQAAKPVINFTKTTHDFGQIEEKGGPVSYSFAFSNTGRVPLILTNVVSSCGCTTPEWPKAPILPGKKGVIKVTFDPMNRPGPIDKTITVSSNATKPLVVLTLSGLVKEKAKDVADLYPRKIGELRMQTSHLAFTRIDPDAVVTNKVGIINTGAKPISVRLSGVPAHLKVSVTPSSLKPNEKGTIVVTYDAKKKNDWGFVVDNMSVLVDDRASDDCRFTVSATVEEDYSKMTPAEMADMPTIKFDRTTYDFGEVAEGKAVVYEYGFKNLGKRDLIIRKIGTSCGCTTGAPSGTIIKPGESGSIKVSFGTSGYSNRQGKTITVITNDPKNPSVVLRLTGNVKPK
ncbi:DUF1573 domain-containing protein [uncultured Acetobacteroides sp.]|uniref:DUF1573 domain-containing protein n=1 Tax=uncultured Acetobacteroides sp. TaxID=1760811 RepID=UPI0029F5B556|nr:DUF1573 domain-containing protein [uncultured Acetobacteroides sp.]